MHKSTFVLLCLTLLGHACRAQSSAASMGNSGASLANLLLASNPLTAFNPSVSASAAIATQRLGHRAPATYKSMQRMSQRAPVTNMLFQGGVTEVEEEVKEEEEFISDEFQQTISDLAFFIMRLSAAAVMIHHGQEKLLNAELFTKFSIDKYFGFLPGPHIFYAYAAGYIQFLAPIFLGLGVFSRVAGASLLSVMLGAFYYSMASVGLEGFPFFEMKGLGAKLKYGVAAFHNYGFETPVLYISIFLLAAAAGPGKFSIAQLLGWNDDKSLLGKLKQ